VCSGRGNPSLVDVAGARPADTALDPGCGEGGDAIWLARQGWRVTAVDVFATALERAASHAASRQRRRGQTLHALTAPSVRRKPLRL
jgi:2-polyprenyl-3-methyl-5-hydroxy-6-metoxy-1,4-benzoquinol methylase